MTPAALVLAAGALAGLLVACAAGTHVATHWRTSVDAMGLPLAMATVVVLAAVAGMLAVVLVSVVSP